MTPHQAQYALILKHTVRIGRRTGYTATAMGDRRSTGETTVTDGMSVWFEYLGGKLRKREGGDFKVQEYRMFAGYLADVREGDMVYPMVGPVGLTLGEVVDVKPIFDFDGFTHHIECLVEKLG